MLRLIGFPKKDNFLIWVNNLFKKERRINDEKY